MVKRIYEKVKSVLFADPNLLFQHEREFINQSFYFPGTNGRGVLLIHGWTSTPYEVRRLGKFLNEAGYTVSGPMLRGHGTVSEDLENVKWQEWLVDLSVAYRELQKNCQEVIIGGTSIGANLAIHLASQEKDAKGLILLATPYKIKFEKISIVVARVMKNFGRYHKKFYPPTFGVSTTITRLIAYQSYPIESALETFDLIKKTREVMPKISQPCLMMQSTHDHIVAKNNLELMFVEVGSERKEKKYIKQAYHTFVSDIKNEHVFEDVLEFINSL